MKNHSMMVEGRRKKGKVKKSTKRSAFSGRFNKLKRQAWNVLGGVGFVAVILVLVWLATMGGG